MAEWFVVWHKRWDKREEHLFDDEAEAFHYIKQINPNATELDVVKVVDHRLPTRVGKPNGQPTEGVPDLPEEAYRSVYEAMRSGDPLSKEVEGRVKNAIDGIAIDLVLGTRAQLRGIVGEHDKMRRQHAAIMIHCTILREAFADIVGRLGPGQEEILLAAKKWVDKVKSSMEEMAKLG